MKTKILRRVIILAAISIIGVVVIQIFWIQKAFDLSNKQFEHNVNIALLNVASSLCEINGSEISPDPIEQLSSNYFIVNLNNKISPGILESVLSTELSKREISNDFEYGIFDCANEEMVYGNYVNLTQNGDQETKLKSKFPELNKDAYYFGIYFPNKTSNMTGQMGIWIFSSIVMLIVVIFFTYTLLVIFKQKRLSEIQKDFINNMTHEFKTPISTIAVSSEVLKTKEIIDKPERLFNYASIIQDEAKRLQNQVDRVLQITTIDKSSIDLKKEFVNVIELINTVCQNIKPSLESKKGKIIFEDVMQDLNLKVDRLHFTNIIYNLLDNAIKYSDRAPVIKLSIGQVNGELEMKICDNGIGMSNDQIKLIYNKFYRVSTGNVHNVKGFGLGLFYVKQIVEAHEGSISVESKLGHGTTFKMTFSNTI